MKKIMNSADSFVDEVLEGIALAYPQAVEVCGKGHRIVVSRHKKQNQVAIVTAGGSGHLPVFLGYVGDGLLDGCAVGNVFASPSAECMFEMIKMVDAGAGVLCLYGNYGGDRMNFSMAEEMADFEGIKTAEVLVCDDVASAAASNAEKRRGVAGMVYAFKIAGAAAMEGKSLEEVKKIAEHALGGIRTMGVALSPCIVPQVGKPTFSIEEDEIEIGMGIHGEPGIEVKKMMPADDIADTMVSKLLEDIPLKAGDEISVMVNGLGATPLEELLIVYRRIFRRMEQLGVRVYMPHIGEFATSMEMAGCSVTVCRLDGQLKQLLRVPCNTPFYTNANK